MTRRRGKHAAARPVRVVMRARPVRDVRRRRMQLGVEEQPDHHIVRFEHAVASSSAAGGADSVRREAFQFTLDRAYLGACTQEALYSESVRGLVESWVGGYNATVMAYGQTGAGKTYTMMGGSTFDDRGVCARAVGHAFTLMEQKQREGYETELRVSFVEIYNDQVYDLLAPSAAKGPKALTVQEDSNGQLHLAGLALQTVRTESRALEMLFEGETNRAVAENKLNSASSRSHCIFAMHLETREKSGLGRSFSSVLNLVDLAGAERRHHTGAVAARQREASYVNRSLSALEQVVLALSDRHRSHIPFRSSTLTRMLHDSIGGNAKTLLISCIWPRLDHAQHTISTLRFAQRMRRVKNVARINTALVGAVDTSDGTSWAQRERSIRQKYEREIRLLREELAMHDALAGIERGSGELPGAPLSARKLADLHEQAQTLVSAAAADSEAVVRDVELRSVREIRALVWSLAKIARANHGGTLQGDASTPREGYSSAVHGARARSTVAPVVRAECDDVMLVASPSSVAAPEGSESNVAAMTTMTQEMQQQKRVAEEEGAPEKEAPVDTAISDWRSIGRDAAFREYKAADGLQVAQMLKEKKSALRRQLQRSKELVAQINAAKDRIDAGARVVQQHRAALAESGGGDASSTAPLLEARRDLKERKKAYRSCFNDLTVHRSDVEYTKTLLAKSREQLVGGFERAWESAMHTAGSVAQKVSARRAEKYDEIVRLKRK